MNGNGASLASAITTVGFAGFKHGQFAEMFGGKSGNSPLELVGWLLLYTLIFWVVMQ